jgi:FAD/FMN-containing dehydrogenase
LDAGAALLIELDGIEAGIDEEADRVKSICLQYGARACRLARDENERKKLWAARKGAFGAIGRISPDSMIQDAVVPRSRLPEVLDAAYQIAAKYQLRIANVFHAGDGNLHPLICFDSRSADEVQRVKEAGRELMETCVRAGGSITGEHGVGFDKRELLPLIFSEADMNTMLRVRAAFDPTGLCNPGKIIPMLRGCGEARAAISEPGAVATGSQAKSNVQRPISNVLSEPRAVATGSQATAKVQRPISNVLSEPGAVATGSQAIVSATPQSSTNSSLSHMRYRPTFDSNAARQQLAELIGGENVSVSPSLRVSPSPLIATPGSIAEVCEVMKLAASERWTVVPAGAMSWLDAGQPLNRVDLIISTPRLNRIIEHEPADLVAIAEAGVTLGAFNDTLAEKGQWLPIDPPDDRRSTLGGVVATGLGGAQQFGYGPPRRHVIGMKVVLADGSLIKVGGRVVKNVAGYDLCKLFTGSYGTLGVIVEVNFKLRPLPFESRTILAQGTREALLNQAQRAIAARLFPVAVELLSPQLARATELSEGVEHLLLIRFAGSLSAVTDQTTRAIEMIDDSNGGVPARIVSADKIIWRSIAALPLRHSLDLVWRVGLRPADVGSFLDVLAQTQPGHDSESIWQAGVGDGRLRVIDRLQNNKSQSREIGNETIGRLDSLRDLAQSLGGTLIIEHAPAEIKTRTKAWGTSGSFVDLMQRIKTQLDPDCILSPGRF